MKTIKISDILYAGAFFDDTYNFDSPENIYNQYLRMKPDCITREVYIPHVTSWFHTSNTPLNYISWIFEHYGETVLIHINGYGMDSKQHAYALRVSSVNLLDNPEEKMPSINTQMHITLALSKDGEPKEAGNIHNWTPIPEFIMVGHIGIFTKPNHID